MSMIEPIKKVMLHSKAAEAIERYVHDNGFKNGDKLPSERELASMLSIGRNSLREALRTLEAMNLVVVINGKGIYVKDVNASESINVQVTSAKVNFLELLDVRRALEVHAIELAVKNATQEDLEKIERALLKIEGSVSQGTFAVEADTVFHHSIYRASHNKTLYELIRPLAETFETLWQPFQQKKELLMETLPLHRPLFEAIKNKKRREAVKIFNQIIDMDEAKIVNFHMDP